jgi:hypothetical protein
VDILATIRVLSWRSLPRRVVRLSRTEDLSVSPHTMKSASRDAVDKLRLDGAPTPRSWVARMKKRPAPTGASKSAPAVGGQREGVS